MPVTERAKLRGLALTPARFKRFIQRLRAPERQPFPGAMPTKEWSIGIYSGAAPTRFGPCPGMTNPVLSRKHVSDVLAAGVADPFMLHVDGTWYMFFEVMNWQTFKGEIGLATSVDGRQWRYRKIVLAEPFHLSYPYVFAWMHDYYMIPESHQARAIRLYRAAKFPEQWVFVGTLVSGLSFSDSSIFHYDGMWWLLTETNSDFKFDTLRLYYAPALTGPWHEHPMSPLIEGNRHTARPAGRVVVGPDTLIRYAQDCSPYYGTQVRALEITRLTTTDYSEREVDASPILQPGSSGWNGSGMHHIDAHVLPNNRWLACVDGWVFC